MITTMPIFEDSFDNISITLYYVYILLRIVYIVLDWSTMGWDIKLNCWTSSSVCIRALKFTQTLTLAELYNYLVICWCKGCSISYIDPWWQWVVIWHLVRSQWNIISHGVIVTWLDKCKAKLSCMKITTKAPMEKNMLHWLHTLDSIYRWGFRCVHCTNTWCKERPLRGTSEATMLHSWKNLVAWFSCNNYIIM